jgi:hypothetical protein
MKHPHLAMDAVLDFDPEPTGRPIIADQARPPAQESITEATPPPHDPVPVDSHLPEASGAPERP